MFEKFLAATVLLVCIVMVLRMALPVAQQRWLDARWRRAQWLLLERWQAIRNWRRRGAAKKAAEAAAEAAIRRARSASNIVDGEWDGNVYRPKRFDAKKRDKRNLHSDGCLSISRPRRARQGP